MYQAQTKHCSKLNIQYFVFSYSYDIDWPHLVTDWIYKDVSLWNDWATTKTDIIIEQGGILSTILLQ